MKMEPEQLAQLGIGLATIGLLTAFFLYRRNDSIVIDNEVVADITGQIQRGAMAFLGAEYRCPSDFRWDRSLTPSRRWRNE